MVATWQPTLYSGPRTRPKQIGLLFEKQFGGACLGRLILDDTGVLDVNFVRVTPRNHWLRVVGLLHALEQTQVVEEGHQLVRLLMAQPVAPSILHKLELRVDALADRCRARLC